MYFAAFTVDVANLTSGNIHFDLYNTTICTDGKGQCDGSTDIDINKFAPFSHDAQSNGSGSTSSSGLSSTSSSGLSSTSSGNVPEPNSSALALIGLGLVAAGFGMRRRRVSQS
jgi:hypothetical protein